MTCYIAYATKDWILPYNPCYITSKWLYNLVRNICCQGLDYVLCNMLCNTLYRYIAIRYFNLGSCYVEFRYCSRNYTQPAQAPPAHTYFQVSYITRYVFSIHCYIDFAETDITCYIQTCIHYYITNRNKVQDILYMTT